MGENDNDSGAAPFAQGGNYRVDLVGGVAMCRVWRRPDVDSQTGARFAEEKIAVVARLTSSPWSMARAFVFDLREAPPVVGPMTQAFLGKILAEWESVRRRVALVAGDSATQFLQLQRLVAEHAPHSGRAFRDIDEARAWAADRRVSRAPATGPQLIRKGDAAGLTAHGRKPET